MRKNESMTLGDESRQSAMSAHPLMRACCAGWATSCKLQGMSREVAIDVMRAAYARQWRRQSDTHAERMVACARAWDGVDT